MDNARGQGFEPQFPRPERGVLPLDDPRILTRGDPAMYIIISKFYILSSYFAF